MAGSGKLFTLEGKALKLDTAADLEPHIAPLRALDDVEEARFSGNTLGIEACKLLGEVLSTKKSLKVRLVPCLVIFILGLLLTDSTRLLNSMISSPDGFSARSLRLCLIFSRLFLTFRISPR
jgi:Ran GTPase-activating protein 1